MKRNVKLMMLTVLFVLLMAGVLTGCNKNIQLDLDGYTAVVYDCMGGNIDRLSARTLYAKPGSLLAEPKGTSEFVAAKKEGYALIGWYSAHGEGSYSESSTGEYVNYYNFTLDKEGKAEYVGYPYYYERSLGAYVAVQGASAEDITYEVYESTNEDHAGLKRYDMVMRYELFNKDEPKHKKLQHYTAVAAYIYYDVNNPDHTALTRYDATFTWDEKDRWDFKTSKVGEKNFTLFARWKKSCKIVYDYNDGSGTSYGFEDGVLSVIINRGEKLAYGVDTIPDNYAGHTFTYWYKNPECTDVWDFNSDTFPMDETVSELRLYAGYVKGNYVRITDKDGLQRIGENLSANYLLLSDIDMQGESMQLIDNKNYAFKGEFNGYGHTVSNIVLTATNNKVEAKAFGLFNYVDGASIHDVTIDITIKVDKKSSTVLYIGGIVGCDLGGSTIKNCNVSLTAKNSGGTCMSDIWAGIYVGKKSNTTIENCTANSNWNAISTEGSLTILNG